MSIAFQYLYISSQLVQLRIDKLYNLDMLPTELHTKLGRCLALKETDIFDLSVSCDGKSYHIIEKHSFTLSHLQTIVKTSRALQIRWWQ